MSRTRTFNVDLKESGNKPKESLWKDFLKELKNLLFRGKRLE